MDTRWTDDVVGGSCQLPGPIDWDPQFSDPHV